jgi:hypothetical protein
MCHICNKQHRPRILRKATDISIYRRHEHSSAIGCTDNAFICVQQNNLWTNYAAIGSEPSVLFLRVFGAVVTFVAASIMNVARGWKQTRCVCVCVCVCMWVCVWGGVWGRVWMRDQSDVYCDGRLEWRVNSRLTDPRRQDAKQGNNAFLKNVSDVMT